MFDCRAHLRRMRRKEHLEALESISDRPSCTRGNGYDYDGIPGDLDFDLAVVAVPGVTFAIKGSSPHQI